MVADYGVNKYDIGTGFGHFGVAVADVSFLGYLNTCLLILELTMYSGISLYLRRVETIFSVTLMRCIL